MACLLQPDRKHRCGVGDRHHAAEELGVSAAKIHPHYFIAIGPDRLRQHLPLAGLLGQAEVFGAGAVGVVPI